MSDMAMFQQLPDRTRCITMGVPMTIFAKRLIRVLPLFLALLMSGYYAHTRQLIAQRLDNDGFPERNFSDLFPRWFGTRELLLNGRDPYSTSRKRFIADLTFPR